MKHPIQNIEEGRFVDNKIVSYLLEAGGIGLNDLAVMDFDNEDREQFAQLIGYSVSGYGNLSYVSDASYSAAEKIELQAKIAALEKALKEIREGLSVEACAAFRALDNLTEEELMSVAAWAAFRIHPDDLTI